MAATTTSPDRSSEEDIVDTTPFLSNSSSLGDDADRNRRSLRRQSLREAARFLRQASSRRLMREPSMLVRESAAEQLEERQSDWAYSRPVVFLDIIWNLTFVVVASIILFLSREESPSMPLRLWILGYALQCVVHMVCVCIEYQKRMRRRRAVASPVEGRRSSTDYSGPEGASEQYVSLAQFEEEGTSIAKHLESANTMFSFVWWIIGFYWISAGGHSLVKESPQLYCLCIIYLAFDVFFVVFCVALACVIGIAVCCCLPCIIAILYAVADQEGASKEDVEQLSKYKFQKIGDVEKLSGEIQGPCGGIMTECGTDAPIEHVLSAEDAECCICLSGYDDGVELRELPCGHHFHSTCVDKWLYINATCPLCKYNILKNSSNGREQV